MNTLLKDTHIGGAFGETYSLLFTVLSCIYSFSLCVRVCVCVCVCLKNFQTTHARKSPARLSSTVNFKKNSNNL